LIDRSFTVSFLCSSKTQFDREREDENDDERIILTVVVFNGILQGDNYK